MASRWNDQSAIGNTANQAAATSAANGGCLYPGARYWLQANTSTRSGCRLIEAYETIWKLVQIATNRARKIQSARPLWTASNQRLMLSPILAGGAQERIAEFTGSPVRQPAKKAAGAGSAYRTFPTSTIHHAFQYRRF